MDNCPECGRKKAKDIDDIMEGACPKWYAIRDPEAEKDCELYASKNEEKKPNCAYCKDKRYVVDMRFRGGFCDKVPVPCPECNKKDGLGYEEN